MLGCIGIEKDIYIYMKAYKDVQGHIGFRAQRIPIRIDVPATVFAVWGVTQGYPKP